MGLYGDIAVFAYVRGVYRPIYGIGLYTAIYGYIGPSQPRPVYEVYEPRAQEPVYKAVYRLLGPRLDIGKYRP